MWAMVMVTVVIPTVTPFVVTVAVCAVAEPMVGVGRVIGGWGGASLAIHPPGIAILVVLLFPYGHSMFDFVDDVSTREECLRAMSGAHAHPDGHLTDRQVADAVYAGSVFNAEARDCFRDDTLAFLDRQRLEGFVFQVADRESFVVVPDPTFERGVAAGGGIKQLLSQFACVDLLAGETECGH
jgi:Na+-translocating ferredoxin:NAD+ oxidoreductase RnfD subunit